MSSYFDNSDDESNHSDSDSSTLSDEEVSTINTITLKKSLIGGVKDKKNKLYDVDIDDEDEIIEEDDVDDDDLIDDDDDDDIEDDEDDNDDVHDDDDDDLDNSKIKSKNKNTKNNKSLQNGYDENDNDDNVHNENTIHLDSSSDNSDSDDDDDDNNYINKFNKEIMGNYIETNHPECMILNYEEISALTNVIRDSDNNIIDPLHRTLPFLTKYEKTRVIGQRAKQIDSGSKPFIKIPDNIIDGYVIAELELKAKVIPFIIRRPLPNGGSEYWKLQDLEVIGF
jgi:DNA-directed RNA polymerase subunit K/omega